LLAVPRLRAGAPTASAHAPRNGPPQALTHRRQRTGQYAGGEYAGGKHAGSGWNHRHADIENRQAQPDD
jgi:hypothetical protein